MQITSPDQMNAAFAQGFNARDLDGMLELFSLGAVVVEHDGTTSAGRAGVERHLQQLFEVPGTMESTNQATLVTGNLALLTARWTIRDESGTPRAGATSAEILARGPDGFWRYLVDSPFAADELDAPDT